MAKSKRKLKNSCAGVRPRRLRVEALEERSLLAAVMTVNSTLDTDARDAVLTLREAIKVSNRTLTVESLTASEVAQIVGTPSANDTDQINFNIPAGDPGHVYYANDNVAGQVSRAKVTPTTAVSDATLADPDPDWPHSWWSIQETTYNAQIHDPLNIDGYTQPGAQLNSSGPGSPSSAVLRIEFTGSEAVVGLTGFTAWNSGATTIRGLAINNFSYVGISVVEGTNSRIEGNYIGTDISGTVAMPNEIGIKLWNEAFQTIIGGSDAAAGNLISGNLAQGIAAGGDQDSCGGGNHENGAATGQIIRGNKIGTDVSGTRPLGNGASGIVIGFNDTSTAAIGGTGTGDGNIIAFNGGSGIVLVGSQTAILSNSIFSNTQLGISFDFQCTPKANDVGDADTGVNHYQNFPVIGSIAAVSGKTQIQGTLNSEASQTYRIDLFASHAKDPTGFGEGQSFLGFVNAVTDANGNAAFTFNAAGFVPAGKFVTATATRLFNGNAIETSQFSTSVEVQGADCGVVVTTTADTENAIDGVTSLREAIICANSVPGADTISFNIPGDGVRRISPLSPLPAITEAVVIDGYTQPGAMANTNSIDDADPAKRGFNGSLRIELSGISAGTTSGLRITGSGSTIRGLIINDFTNSGISIEGGDNNSIAGNMIGTDPSGMAAAGNDRWGVLMFAGASGNTVGTNGDGLGDPAERNVISANGFGGVGVSGAGTGNNIVAGNFIGTDSAGTSALGNTNRGVDICTGATGNRIGTNADAVSDGAERNLISGNLWDGIALCNAGTSANLVAGNWIGVDISGELSLPNEKSGVVLFGGATNNTIGGTAAAAGNIIAFNAFDGVGLLDATTIANSVLGNSMFSNGDLGIDLGPTGVTPNDADDADTGPNNRQNFPQLTGAVLVNGLQMIVGYEVPSTTDNSSYPLRVEFFKADSSGAEGQTYLGFDTFLASEAAGSKAMAFTSAAAISAGERIVATATDAEGNTSEFSASIVVGCSLDVVNTADAGAGSLRDAITCANATPGADTIGFYIPGTGVKTISPLSPLPAITEAVTIDGYTRPGAMANTLDSGNNAQLLVELDGSLAGSGAKGLTITAGNSTVRGLVINRFDVGIRISGTGQNVIAGNFIGTDAGGVADLGNRSHGISIEHSAENTIGGDGPADRNLIAGNDGNGVHLAGGFNTTVSGNIIGQPGLGNGRNGVQIGDFPQFMWQAENFTSRSSFGGESWLIVPGEDPGIANHTNYLGTGYLQVLPDAGPTNTPATGSPFETSPIASYEVTISEPGTYQLFLRWDGHDGMSDSLYARVLELTDGTGSAADWYRVTHLSNLDFAVTPWQGTGGLERTDAAGGDVAMSWNFPRVGKYTIQLGFREDGVAVDALVLQLASLPAPTGDGPSIVVGANGNVIGGEGGLANRIAGNGGAGVFVGGSAIDNAILGNSIEDNAGLGIDIGEVGANANDADDADFGANNLQNFPAVSYATLDAGKLKVTYSVDSDPAANAAAYPIRVEFFEVDATGQEGQAYLGFDTFTAADFAAGGKTVTFTTNTLLKVFDKIVATSTDSLVAGGPANTSEFSESVVIASPWFNPGRRWDVNGDTEVVADDVVAIINYINAKGSGKVPDLAANVKPFVDVTGDNNVAADDVVAVINYINAGLAEEEGEGEADMGRGGQGEGEDLVMLLAMDVAEWGVRKRK
jgi:hypothetical protein